MKKLLILYYTVLIFIKSLFKNKPQKHSITREHKRRYKNVHGVNAKFNIDDNCWLICDNMICKGNVVGIRLENIDFEQHKATIFYTIVIQKSEFNNYICKNNMCDNELFYTFEEALIYFNKKALLMHSKIN